MKRVRRSSGGEVSPRDRVPCHRTLRLRRALRPRAARISPAAGQSTSPRRDPEPRRLISLRDIVICKTPAISVARRVVRVLHNSARTAQHACAGRPRPCPAASTATSTTGSTVDTGALIRRPTRRISSSSTRIHGLTPVNTISGRASSSSPGSEPGGDRCEYLAGWPTSSTARLPRDPLLQSTCE